MAILAKFTDMNEAKYIKELLEQNQVKCRLHGDHDSEEIDRVELVLLNEHDLERAQEIINNDSPEEI